LDHLTKADIIFADLDENYSQIMNSRRKPKYFRHLFEQYIVKSQQLTDVMRREFKQLTGCSWSAGDFSEWTIYTKTLKSLRNAALHGEPIIFNEVIISIYPAVEFSLDSEPLDKKDLIRGFRAFKVTCFIDNPFAEAFITPHQCYQLKHRTHPNEKSMENYAVPIKEFVSYQVQWPLSIEILKGSDMSCLDAVKLLLKAHPTLRKYIKFYRKQLQARQLFT
jgi:hypothetical protein